MGIHKFGKWVNTVDSQQGQPDKKVKGNRIPSNVGCLFVDMNGIFHNEAQMVYVYEKGDPTNPKYKRDFEQDKEMYKTQLNRKKYLDSKSDEDLENELFGEIVRKIKEVIDRINPSDYAVLAVDGVAPMAKITQQRKRRYEGAKGSKSGSRFDSNCITPGTEFMMRLDVVIQSFIAHCIKNGLFRVKNIIYSSHLTSGEGEHKIFNMVKRKHFTPDPEKANVVYGKDADLFMLTLLSDINFLYLCREDYKETYNIDAFRNYLSSQMTTKDFFELDIKQVCRDFVVIIFLIGNDFVPDNIYFEDVPQVINDMLTIYNITELPLTDDEGQIIWKNLGHFLKGVAKKEKKYLETMVKKMSSYDYKFPILEASSTYEKSESGIVAKVDLEKFKSLWYQRALTPMSELGKSVIDLEVSKDKINDMCLEYIKAFQWILQYYTKGQKAVSSRYVYIYHFNPVLSDLAELLLSDEFDELLPKYTDVLHSKLDPTITPIHQLISVMPPKSWKLIPEPYRALMPVRFMDICPTDFEVIREAKVEKDKFISTAIISIVDPIRIDRDIADVPVPKKYQEKTPYFLQVIINPRVPKGYAGIKNDLKFFKEQQRLGIEETNYKIQPESTPEEIYEVDYEAKSEPKSVQQVERIIREKIKSRSIVKRQRKENKPNTYMYVAENLI